MLEKRMPDRYRKAALVLERHGFRSEIPPRDALRRYQPFKAFDDPQEALVRAVGRCGDAYVEIYEYEYSSTDSDGNTSTSDTLVACVLHPKLCGSAVIFPDAAEWGGAAAIFLALWNFLTWFPPFIILKLVHFIHLKQNPDRVVGQSDFDRLYVVRASSNEAAAQAVPPLLRKYLLATRFHGRIELRPGLMIYSVRGARFRADKIELLLAPLKGLLESTVPCTPCP